LPKILGTSFQNRELTGWEREASNRCALGYGAFAKETQGRVEDEVEK
jgi:hypothetical protein